MRFWNGKKQEVRKIIPVLFIVLAFLAVSCDAEFPSPEDEFEFDFSDRIETPEAVEPPENVKRLIKELKNIYNSFEENISSSSLTSIILQQEAIYLTDANQFGFHEKSTRYSVGHMVAGSLAWSTAVAEYRFGDVIDDEDFIQNGAEVKVVIDYDDASAGTSPQPFTIISFLINGEEIGKENYCCAQTELTEAISLFTTYPYSEIHQITENTTSEFEYESIQYVGTVEKVILSKEFPSSSDDIDKLTFSLQGWGYKGINKVIVYNDKAVELQGSSDLAGTYRYSGFASSSGQELTEPALLI